MEIQVFNHAQFGQLRSYLDEEGIPWFFGNDVASAMGYADTTKAIRMHVMDEDKRFEMVDIKADGQNVRLLGKTKTTFINESGLYSLILSSKLPSAKVFKHWVTSVVLPQIRKTGGYIPVNKEDDDETIVAKALIICRRTLEECQKLPKNKNFTNELLN